MSSTIRSEAGRRGGQTVQNIKSIGAQRVIGGRGHTPPSTTRRGDKEGEEGSVSEQRLARERHRADKHTCFEQLHMAGPGLASGGGSNRRSSNAAGYDSFGTPPRCTAQAGTFPGRGAVEVIDGGGVAVGVAGGSSGDDDGDDDIKVNRSSGGIVRSRRRGTGGAGRGAARGGSAAAMTTSTAGLLVWATAATLVAVFLAVDRGGSKERGGGGGGGGERATATAVALPLSAATTTTTATTKATTTTAASTTTTAPTALASKPTTSFDVIDDVGATAAAAPGPGLISRGGGNTWCLPNAAQQSFSGVVVKADDGIMPHGDWEGKQWWYHDEITNGFHMVATIGGETFGFWDLSIVGAAGNTEYVAAYRGDECLFYEEKVQPGSTPFDEDVTCRGSGWAGNVTLKDEVELGYGTKAERWSGTILEAPGEDASGYGGLPPGTKSLVLLQRNPANGGEVRLLYHRVVAPTEGVLGWAGGDSIAFDLVFSGEVSMAASDVLDLVKVPPICDVMAGEFHDQQARGHEGGGAIGGGARRRALRRVRKRQTAPSSHFASSDNESIQQARERGDVGATPWRRRERESKGSGTAERMGEGGGSVAGVRSEKRLLEAQEEEEEQGQGETFRDAGQGNEEGRGNGRDRTDRGAIVTVPPDFSVAADLEGFWAGPSAEQAAVTVAGLLPIHELLRSLSPWGKRRRG